MRNLNAISGRKSASPGRTRTYKVFGSQQNAGPWRGVVVAARASGSRSARGANQPTGCSRRASRGNRLVLLAGHLSLLLEAMQYVDGFLELGNVYHAVDAARVPDANLSCTGAHIVERLPVGRVKSGLDLPQLEPRFLPGVSWECQQIVVGRPYPTEICFSSSILPVCIKLYTRPLAQVKLFAEHARQTTISGAWEALSAENAGVGK